MAISCGNCGSLNLSFIKAGPASQTGGTYVARFTYPFVDRTYVCKANLKVTYLKDKINKDFVYGMYFCPEDPSSKSRICDKSGALEKCGF